MSRVRVSESRSSRIAGYASVLLGAFSEPQQTEQPFTFEQVVAKAQAVAGVDPKPRVQAALPEALARWNYDQYRKVQFRRDSTLWMKEGLPFQAQFFHRGYLYQDAVHIHVVDGARVEETTFSPAQYDYGDSPAPSVPDDLGYAGVRILSRLNDAVRYDEIVSFLGASYFRILGAQQRYGLSARALTVDTALPSGEEFPAFTEFWLEKPGPDARSVKLFALLESASLAGAYRFEITPGASTSARVHAVLFVRKRISKLGIAPLSGMFKFGENRTRYLGDFRPEVHDTDGVLIANGSEWIWRPLNNPEKVHQVSRFPCDRLQGFGLLQRDRRFESYEDLEARFDQCPSVWMEPESLPRKGVLELVEIPSPTEFNDNIAVYWVGEVAADAGSRIDLDYTLRAFTEDPTRPPLARASSTFVQPNVAEHTTRFLIDFAPPTGAELVAESAITPVVGTSRGEIRNAHTHSSPSVRGERMFFDLVAEPGDPIELRAKLVAGDRPLSETWVYHWTHP